MNLDGTKKVNRRMYSSLYCLTHTLLKSKIFLPDNPVCTVLFGRTVDGLFTSISVLMFLLILK